MFRRILQSLFLVGMLTVGSLQASTENVVKYSVKGSMDQVYPAVYEALENARFFVIFEPYISKNLARFSERWGENYNRSQLDSIRSMVFCHAWYANEVSNKDPDMLSLCPLRVGLYQKDGMTHVVFARPSVIAEHSPARGVLLEAEQDIIRAIQKGLARFK